MSYDANIDAIWEDARITKNGIPFKRYDDLPEGDYVKSHLKQEDGSFVIINGSKFVLKMYENGSLVFRNPIKSNDIRPTDHQQNNHRYYQPEPHQQTALNLQHIEWLKQAANNSEMTLQSVKRIEELLTEIRPLGQEHNADTYEGTVNTQAQKVGERKSQPTSV